MARRLLEGHKAERGPPRAFCKRGGGGERSGVPRAARRRRLRRPSRRPPPRALGRRRAAARERLRADAALLVGYQLYGAAPPRNSGDDRLALLQALPASTRLLFVSGEKDEFLDRTKGGTAWRDVGAARGVAALRAAAADLPCAAHATVVGIENTGQQPLEQEESGRSRRRRARAAGPRPLRRRAGGRRRRRPAETPARRPRRRARARRRRRGGRRASRAPTTLRRSPRARSAVRTGRKKYSTINGF